MLNPNVLMARFNEALKQADEDMARKAGVPDIDVQAKARQNSQRIALAKALADTIVAFLKEYAEVELPDHDPFRSGIWSGRPRSYRY